MEASTVHARLRHAKAAIIAEDHSTKSSKYALSMSSSSSSPRHSAPANTTTTSNSTSSASRDRNGGHINNLIAPSPSEQDEADEFAIGLQLLQNDVVALCIRAGVPVAALWPAGAMLLNLHALWIYCQVQVMKVEEDDDDGDDD